MLCDYSKYIPATCDPTQENITFVGRDDYNRAVYMKYNFVMNSWSRLYDTGASLEDKPGITVYDRKIFFIGGEDIHANKLPRASYFDMATNKLKTLPQLEAPRSGPTVVGLKNQIFVVGGNGRYANHPLSLVESLDLAKPEAPWVHKRQMKKWRDETARGFAFDDKFMVVGGGWPQPEFFTWATTSWTLCKAIPCENEMSAASIYGFANGHLYGFKQYRPDGMHALDIPRNEWSFITNKGGRPPDYVVCAVGWQSVIFVIDTMKQLHTFNVVTRNWNVVTKVPKCLAHPVYVDM